MGEIAANARNVSDAHIRKALYGARDHGRDPGHLGRVLDEC
jgi:hypothetical protein